MPEEILSAIAADTVVPGDIVKLHEGDNRREVETVVLGHLWVRLIFVDCTSWERDRCSIVMKIN